MAKKKQQGSTAPESVEDLEGEVDRESLEEAIAKLTPEQAEMFMNALTLTMKKRKLMLMGTLLALLVLVVGTFGAFVTFANRAPGSFMIWVFLVPFAGAGFCMWFFGRLAKRTGVQSQSTLSSPTTAQSSNP
ncbi:MAG: hypothetical protein GY811_15440 [Myxococcales bacterium]|nr:hypothetical protein [Myxococcales bacterium]